MKHKVSYSRDTGPSHPRRVFLDHNSTTPILPEILEKTPEWMESWGNPSSVHFHGRGPKKGIREAKVSMAQCLKVHPLELVVTSGGSESNNQVIRSIWDLQQEQRVGQSYYRNTYIASLIEHPSVIQAYKYLERLGARVVFIPVDREGRFDMEFFQSQLNRDVALVSVMLANNETGTLMPIKKIVQKAHEVGALVHSDGVQALGKIGFNLRNLDLDYASFSGHKINGLKGAGLIYAKKGAPLRPLIYGGGQERHRRAGTENVLAISAMGMAMQRLVDRGLETEKMAQLRDHMETRVSQEISDIEFTGKGGARLPNTSSFIVKGVSGETLLMSLDLRGFSVSTGAACSSGSTESSPVLRNMGLTHQEASESLRVSIGDSTTEAEIDRFVDVLSEEVIRLRELFGLEKRKEEFHVTL